MPDQRITLTQFIIESQRSCGKATGDFSGLLNDIATACKVIANNIGRGALAGTLGSAGGQNVQGEEQKQLDLIADSAMRHGNQWAGHLAGMASEEQEDIIAIPDAFPRGRYLLLFDPLDGSSNIDVNIAVGTIFSVLKSPRPGAAASLEDFLQPGTEQVCAGFALYGPQTMLILTTGQGVNGFTLDHGIGEFILTHPLLRIPEETQEFAINASNERFWEPPVQRYVEECLAGKSGPRSKDFNMRWIASLVAEAYRILIRGGVFMYPRDSKNPKQPGRLRLMYEANPISFIIEQAGGGASTGHNRIMSVLPESLHQRVPFVFGSKREVERINRYHHEYVGGNEREEDRSPLFATRSLFRN
ncbi:MAG: class 1 fructose-bisphosphatase [Betaproteobacteria bacterium]|nr:class 1 fructose-bisphosphatase [Betaproteobacteria bacterium]